MRQLEFIQSGSFEWRDVPTPALQFSHEALVRPFAVATCDLDRAVARGQAPVSGPFAFGHEGVAEVLDVGSDVTGFRAGDIVAVPFQVSCGVCAACRSGRTAHCTGTAPMTMYGLGGLSGENWGGFLADVVRVPHADHMLVPVPADVDPVSVASLSDNISDGWRLVAPQLAERPGAAVLIVAGASVSLYAAAIALALGASQVDYVGGGPLQKEIAQRLGARVVDGPVPERLGCYPITVNASSDTTCLHCALRSTAPGRRLHQRRGFLRGGRARAADGDVPERNPVPDRPGACPRRDAPRARSGRGAAYPPRMGDLGAGRLGRCGSTALAQHDRQLVITLAIAYPQGGLGAANGRRCVTIMAPSGAVLVTGAGAGIGRAVVERLANRGYHVFAGLHGAARPIALRIATVTGLALDITDETAIGQAVDQIESTVGERGLRGLVNSAGIIVEGPLELIPVGDFRRQLEVNVTGRFAVTRALLPALRRARGRVINIGAISGRTTAPFFGGPAAASAAFAALSDAMRMEFAPFGVQVSLLEPGAIQTDIFAKAAKRFDDALETQPRRHVDAYREAIVAVRRAFAKGHADPPSRVVDAVESALITPGRPKPRVLVGKGAVQVAMIGWLPVGLRDRVLMSALGLVEPMAAAARALRQ